MYMHYSNYKNNLKGFTFFYLPVASPDRGESLTSDRFALKTVLKHRIADDANSR